MATAHAIASYEKPENHHEVRVTKAQKFKYYFPAWQAAIKANGWHLKNKTVVIAEERLTEEGRKVLTFARQRASTRNFSLQPSAFSLSLDDLRHGAHVLALGRDKSSDDLTNPEVDRIVTLFNLLADPDDLAARLKWDAYQRGEDPGADKRLDWFIRHSVPEAYARAISEDKFGTRNWEWLELSQKRSLAMTLAARKKAKGQRLNAEVSRPQTSVASVPSVPASTDDPDWTV